MLLWRIVQLKWTVIYRLGTAKVNARTWVMLVNSQLCYVLSEQTPIPDILFSHMCWYPGPKREFFFFLVTQDLGNHEPVLILCCSESDVWNHCSEDMQCACHCFSFVVVMTMILALSPVVIIGGSTGVTRSSYLYIIWCLDARNVIFSQELTYFTYLLINSFSKYVMIITTHQILYRRLSIG